MVRRLSAQLILFLIFVPSLLHAQGQDAPRVEVFGGYSWYRPGGTIPAVAANGFVAEKVPDLEKGWAGQFTYNLSHWAGITLDANGHYHNEFGDIYSLAVGPQFKLRRGKLTPFGEILLGAESFRPKLYPSQYAASFFAGGGLQYAVSRRFSVRLFQADYVNSYYTKLSPTATANTFNGVRLQAGLVVNFGLPAAAEPPGATCNADPETVVVGAPVAITVTTSGFAPQDNLNYSYTAMGFRIPVNASSATVDTTNLAPGNYTVGAQVTDARRHKRTASCTTSFTVNEPPKHPPVLNISIAPTTLNPGDTATVTANGSSPDNRPLAYRCTTSAGRLTGNGPAFTLETAQAAPGNIQIECSVSDDRNLTASASASVQVNAPAPVAVAPAAPPARDFGDILFMRDSRRPTRVDNQAKGELDRFADALAASPDSRGVVVGHATAEENAPSRLNPTPNFAAQRAVNTKDYLTREKGIDPARIEARTFPSEGQKVELWIVPAGATFQEGGTTLVDEVQVKAVPRGTLPAKHVHKRPRRHAKPAVGAPAPAPAAPSAPAPKPNAATPAQKH